MRDIKFAMEATLHFVRFKETLNSCYLFLELSHHPKQKPCTHWQFFSSSFPPALDNYWNLLLAPLRVCVYTS